MSHWTWLVLGAPAIDVKPKRRIFNVTLLSEVSVACSLTHARGLALKLPNSKLWQASEDSVTEVQAH